MTREEAIKGLTSLVEVRRKYICMQTMKDEIECLDMATKALEQEPCDDCISRKAVLNLAKKGILVSNGNYERVCKAINEIPSVNPQPKTGRWIISQNDYFVNCSECGLHGDKGIYKHYRWCPHCGAKMQESEK